MQRKPLEQPMHLLTIRISQSTKHLADLRRVLLKNAANEPSSGGGEGHVLGPLVGCRCHTRDKPCPLEPIDHARHTGRANEQTIAEIGQAKLGSTFIFGARKGPQDGPLAHR